MTTYSVPNKPMDKAITEQMLGGYRIVDRNETGATMARPKEFSFLAFLLLTLCGIVPGVLYVGWYMAKRDSMLHMEQQRDGSLVFTFH